LQSSDGYSRRTGTASGGISHLSGRCPFVVGHTAVEAIIRLINVYVFDRSVADWIRGDGIAREELITIAEEVVIVIDQVTSLTIVSAILRRGRESVQRVVTESLLPLLVCSDEALDSRDLTVVLRLVQRPGVDIDLAVLVFVSLKRARAFDERQRR
jgi:hypothetical protein